jgi:hypothetical protein
MCGEAHWATDDPLGIGGLLDDAVRLAQLVVTSGVERRDLLVQLLRDATSSLQAFANTSLLSRSVDERLAFRELGLSIGLHGLPQIAKLTSQDRELANLTRSLLEYQPLSEPIERLWCNPVHQNSRVWMEHRDINMVMLATSLAPQEYLTL